VSRKARLNPASGTAVTRRGKSSALLAVMLCALPLATAACTAGLTVPQVDLRALTYSHAAITGRHQVAARIQAAITALESAGMDPAGNAVEDYCATWAQLQGNDAITEWGLECTRAEVVFGKFSTSPARQISMIEHALRPRGWARWGQLMPDSMCGNYAAGGESQTHDAYAVTALGDPWQVDVIAGPGRGPVAKGNVQYLLGCLGCGPDARPDDIFDPEIDSPMYYAQHTCPSSRSIENTISSGQAGMWEIEIDSGYVHTTNGGGR
jgi:hypothetical protein